MVLTKEQSRAVVEHFETIRRAATKFHMTTQQPGSLLIIEPAVVNEVKRFLDALRLV